MNKPQTNKNKTLHFENLVNNIEQIHHHFQQQAVKAVNVSLTIRNWLIGFYIVEFEQNGADRAKYGEKLMKSLSDKISGKGLSETNLKLSRQFFKVYPEMMELFNSSFKSLLPKTIGQLVTDEIENSDNENTIISQLSTDEFKKKEDLPNKLNYYRQLIEKVSFTHFVELLKIEDKTKRSFYELFILKATPSIIEFKRQINSLAYERVGLSANTEIAFEQLHNKIEPEQISDAVKSVFFFDFLGLKSNDLVEEQELETALINHLQAFIQELGIGFCFEARQKRILIDDEYYFTDLVFYHRILKCHILIELKIDSFKHEHLSQLNTYVAYFNAEIRRFDDNPAIGILLCTEKGKKLVEYATAGMDNQLFVSKYLLELPKKEQLEEFIEKELKNWEKR
ncbi:MAG: PDDEXK nuclease domain-containing protein [Crocinitomicaceae bacterium]|jgi:predicted nuclease of restriction endonuclease-like (RecB) superfamily